MMIVSIHEDATEILKVHATNNIAANYVKQNLMTERRKRSIHDHSWRL